MATAQRFTDVGPRTRAIASTNGSSFVISRTRISLWITIVGFASVVLIGGAPGSPMAVDLPRGVRPLAVFEWTSRAFHLSSLTPVALSLLAQAAVLLAVGGFLLLLRECWRGNVAVRTVVITAVVLHAIAVAMPLIVSHDVYSYILYGRIASLHHANPYLAPPSHFSGDPFYPLVSKEWRGVTSLYGPAFVQLAGLITRLIRSPSGLIAAFKLVSGAASLATMFVVLSIARRLRPERRVFAAALVGINPLVIFDTVAGGHMDSMVALSLALAAWVLSRERSVFAASTGRLLLATGALTLGALVKPPFWICVVLFVVVAVGQRAPQERWRHAAAHLLVAGGLTFVLVHPFLQASDPALGLTSAASYENELTPAVFVGVTMPLLLGARTVGGVFLHLAKTGLLAVFVVGFLLVLACVLHRNREVSIQALGASWGWTLLLLLLAAPIAWPWYVIWLLPVAWMLPKGPRTAAIVMGSLYAARTVVGEWHRFHPLFGALRSIGLLVIAPVLLWLLIRVFRELVQRLRHGTGLEAELVDPGLPVLSAAGPIASPELSTAGRDHLATKMTPSSSW